jgi:hypothetical protein
MEYIVIVVIIAIAVIVGIVYGINRKIFNKYDRFVRKTSPLYKKLTEVNKKYTFNIDVQSRYEYSNPNLKSKRGLDNLNLSDYLFNILSERESAFYSVFDKLKRNSVLWKAYQTEYEKITDYTTPEEIEKIIIEQNLKIKAQVYNKHEIRIFEKEKLDQPVIQTSVYCHVSYTSPAGKSHHYKNNTFTHEEVYRTVLLIKHRREETQRIEAEKLARKAAIKTKEEKLRYKEKEIKARERKLANIEQREKDLVSKEEEFVKATKDHIYSSSAVEQEAEDFDSLSPYEQLKRLKQMLDNGDIDYGEYNQRRKEIAG